MNDVDDRSGSWDLTPEEERGIERESMFRSCGCVLGVLALLAVGLVAGALLLLFRVSDQTDAFCSSDSGSFRFVDRPAPELAAAAVAVPSATSLVISGVSIDEPTETVGLGVNASPAVLYPRLGSALDPRGRFLVVYETSQKREVIDLQRRQVSAEFTGDEAQFMFTGPGTAVLFQAEDCEFAGAKKFNLVSREVAELQVSGVSDVLRPVATAGRELIVERLVPGSSSLETNGIFRINLKTGRALELSPKGTVDAVSSSSSPTVWATRRDRLAVLALSGRVRSTGPPIQTAVALSGDRMAYVYAYPSEDTSIHIAAAGGPTSDDPVLVSSSTPDTLFPGPRPDTFVVAWSDDVTHRNGYDICDVTLLTCTAIAAAEDSGLPGQLIGFLG